MSPQLHFTLSFEDYPKPADWPQVKGLFTENDTAIISSFANTEDHPDIILRFGYPIDLRPAPSRSVILSLATAEYGTADVYRAFGSPSWSKLGNVTLMIPSHWSMTLFQDIEGVPASNMLYLPHGYDPSYFFPSKGDKSSPECLRIRQKLGIARSNFIFLNTGAATMNKNIVILIQVFAKISAKYPGAVLLLKSLTELYPQGVENIHRAVSNVTQEVVDRIIWLDKISSNEYMGSLFRCANVYVAPYQAEGFNLPVLESLASGTPVIIPHGGSTDDFTRKRFTRYIHAVISETVHPHTQKILNRILRVDEDSLYEEMKYVLDDYERGMIWLNQASKSAAKFVSQRYQWKHIFDKLLIYLNEKYQLCLPLANEF